LRDANILCDRLALSNEYQANITQHRQQPSHFGIRTLSLRCAQTRGIRDRLMPPGFRSCSSKKTAESKPIPPSSLQTAIEQSISTAGYGYLTL
jgi:hypothetical protein